MFKKKISNPLLLLPLSLAVVAYFQNCSPFIDMNGMPVQELSSLAPEDIQMRHEDSDQTLPGEEKAFLETTYEPLLMDRQYLKSLFVDIFGASATATGLGPSLFADAAEFGSPCSTYEDYSVRDKNGKSVRESALKACSAASPSLTQSQNIPKPTAKRQAFINRYCSDLVSNTTTFSYAMKRISAQNNPAPTYENLSRLFYLFYRAHPKPDDNLITSISLMFSGSTADANEWRAAILAVCTSSQWQVL